MTPALRMPAHMLVAPVEAATAGVSASPMVLSDRLLTLAEDAAHAGFQITADKLIALAHYVFDEKRLNG